MSPDLFPQQKQNSRMQHTETSMKRVYFKNKSQSWSCLHACVQYSIRQCSSPCISGRTAMGILSCANKENILIFPQVPSQRIVLKWRCRSWPDGEFFQGSLILEGSFAGRRTKAGREQPELDTPLVCVLRSPAQPRELWKKAVLRRAKQRGNQQHHHQQSFFKKHFTEGSCFLPSEHYATVALNFQDLAAQSELELECKGVPVSHEESTRQCWKKQYFEEIHILLQQSKDNMEW